ncbi:MAG: hypothetical protein JNK29_13540, partial [Anaerolineales bacterium]|nr:hypothetical protein [Anaerolineales bacterium]
MQRSLTRRWIVGGLLVFGLAVVAALTRPPATAAQVEVQGGVVTNCGNDTQLRTAVATGGSVTFACPVTQTTIFLSGPITVTLPTTVDGGGVIALDGNFSSRIFNVVGGALTLQNITLQNGRSGFEWGGAITVGATSSLTAVNTRFIGNISGIQSGGRGGAIYSSGGLISATASVFQSNSAEGDGGGAIYALGQIDLLNTDFITNTGFTVDITPPSGAAIFAEGPVRIQGGTLRGNTLGSIGNGGALFALQKVTVQNTTFLLNSAGNGGAVYLAGGSLDATNTNFISNQAGFSSVDAGGAIFSNAQPVTITGGLFQGNSTGGSGGAFYSSGLTLFKSTQFTGNSAGFNGGGAYLVDPLRVSSGQRVVITDTVFQLNTGGVGGGLYLDAGADLQYTRFISNTAGSGGGAYIPSGAGQIALARTLFISNTASASGGGLFVSSAVTATLQDSILDANTTAGGAGGGLYNAGVALVNRSAVIYLRAGGGGGLYNDFSGYLTVHNTTVSNNDGQSSGAGGLHNAGLAVVSNT